MGLFCGECNAHRAIKQHITTHQLPTNDRAANVIGARLECGHEVYGKESREYQKALEQANAEYVLAVEQAKANLSQRNREAWLAIKASHNADRLAKKGAKQ